MAEYIDKEELEKFKYLSIVTYEGGKKENKAVIAIGCEIFNELPTIDIVHCKECKHWKDSDGVYRRGYNAESKCKVNCEEVMRGTWFCADGERNEDD